MDTLDSRRAQVRARIAQVREALRRHGATALLVPSSDPHISEYLPPRWQGREWLSGFTGSVGTLVVTPEFTGLWVDSRYYVQAEAQLAGTGIEMMKLSGPSGSGYVDWLAANVPSGGTVLVDGAVLGLGMARTLETALAARGVKLRTDVDVLDEVWKDRAGLPTQAVYAHELAPVARQDKLAAVRAEVTKLGATHHFVSTVDDIAWLTNLRGQDVDYNPVFIAHLLLDMQGAQLFIAEGKVPAALAAQLAADGIRLAPYAQAAAALGDLPGDAVLLIDPKRVTYGLRRAVKPSLKVVEAINPSTMLRVAQDRGRGGAHPQRDGAGRRGAVRILRLVRGGARQGDDHRAHDRREDRRGARQAARLRLPSFSTIAAFNANGAMPHYRATETSHATIGTQEGTACC